jgi:hypothetical protein
MDFDKLLEILNVSYTKDSAWYNNKRKQVEAWLKLQSLPKSNSSNIQLVHINFMAVSFVSDKASIDFDKPEIYITKGVKQGVYIMATEWYSKESKRVEVWQKHKREPGSELLFFYSKFSLRNGSIKIPVDKTTLK